MASAKDYTLGLSLFPATYGVSTSPKHLSLVCVITANVHLNRMSWNIREYAERWSMGLPNNCLCILMLKWNWTTPLSQQNSALLQLSRCPWLIKTQKSAYKRKHICNLMFILFGVLGTVRKRHVLLYIWEDHSCQNMIPHSHPTQFGPSDKGRMFLWNASNTPCSRININNETKNKLLCCPEQVCSGESWSGGQV